MRTQEFSEGLAFVSLDGLSLRELGGLGESVVASALRSVLDPEIADDEAVAAFINEGDD
ncbi:FXSXX-COOH protein [Nocardiopsis algeriensis]|uniref:FXSXX-COOH protein n=1 Tax=Nocardiopsis algeriensis TaxID=1478215 RepID=A0A841IPQ0_9ACTN|nr:FXSXX-COOH protein [Nocardiopsis algeriensis]MBB6120160.1 FXSXX-COOH protein [Nocardiopsis algeriensis]